MQLPFDGARHNSDQGGPGQRWRLLQLLPLHPSPLLRLLWVAWHLRPSWHSLCVWMLVLTLLVISCIRWTPMSVVSHNDRQSWVVSLLLLLHLHQPLRMRVTMAPTVMMLMKTMVLARLVIMRCYLMYLPFVTRDKNGEYFWDESSHAHRGRVSIGDFVIEEVYMRDVVRIFVFFLFFLF